MAIAILSARVKMTQLCQADWPLFKALRLDSDVTALCFDTPTMAEIQMRFTARLQPWHVDSPHWLCLTIQHRTSGQKLGVTGFCLQDGIAEVGYLLLPSSHGKGCATESLKALLSWAISDLNIHHFRAVVTEGNEASAQVLLKNGFVLTRVIPDTYEIGGRLYADHIFTRGAGA
ncbi:GNAT family N-acetyltransferase [Shewanella sp.]|uniref:GNAT family N-acetyltransferase n=1 Tax=Shewanella sp. TaxID=50422 RepID=UPI003A985903